MKKLIAILALVFALAAPAAFAGDAKFRSVSELEPAIGRYLVTLNELAVAENPEALATRLAAQIGGRLEPFAREGFRGFVIVTTPAKARMLSNDPRISLVEEQASVVSAAPPPATAAPPAIAVESQPAALRATTNAGSSSLVIGPFIYDSTGNVSTINGTRGLEKYHYDSYARLVRGELGAANLWQAYEYDRYGNITRIKTPSVPDRSIGINAQKNHILPATPATEHNVFATYDDAGSMLTLQATAYGLDASFEYDGLSMVTASTIGGNRTTYLYNASNERVVTKDWTGEQRWTIRDAANQVLRRFTRTSSTGPLQWDEDYVYRGPAMVAAYVNAPEKSRHFHVDHLGSPRLITAGGGTLLSEHRYYPFGEEFTARNQDGERKKFTGHERDFGPSASGDLDYMHARYYAIIAGRFLTVDVAPPDPHRPQSWNRYSYASNAPNQRVDPTGKKDKPPGYVGQGARFILQDAARPGFDFLASVLTSNGPNFVKSSYNILVSEALSRIPVVGPVIDQFLGGYVSADVSWESPKPTEPSHLENLKSIYSEAMTIALYGNFDSNGKTIALWGGGEKVFQAANAWAKKNDAMTIGDTPAGAALHNKRALLAMLPEQWRENIWRMASVRFVGEGTGAVAVFDGLPADSKNKSILYLIEVPTANGRKIYYFFLPPEATSKRR